MDLRTGQKFNAYLKEDETNPKREMFAAAGHNPQTVVQVDITRILAVDSADNEREFVRSIWQFKIIEKG